MKVLVINGPNLNFVGIREVSLYGKTNYNQVCQMISKKCADLNVVCEIFQSNHEGAIIDKLQQAYYDETTGIVINPGAYGHYSYAIHDAITSIKKPVVEVHITDIKAREEVWKNNRIMQ